MKHYIRCPGGHDVTCTDEDLKAGVPALCVICGADISHLVRATGEQLLADEELVHQDLENIKKP